MAASEITYPLLPGHNIFLEFALTAFERLCFMTLPTIAGFGPQARKIHPAFITIVDPSAIVLTSSTAKPRHD